MFRLVSLSCKKLWSRSGQLSNFFMGSRIFCSHVTAMWHLCTKLTRLQRHRCPKISHSSFMGQRTHEAEIRHFLFMRIGPHFANPSRASHITMTFVGKCSCVGKHVPPQQSRLFTHRMSVAPSQSVSHFGNVFLTPLVRSHIPCQDCSRRG